MPTYVGARHAVAFSSATAALHGAAIRRRPRSRATCVHTSPLTFIASANCARYVGATTGLVDIDPTTWNLDVSQRRRVGRRARRRPLRGPARATWRGSRSRPRVVIEDASHALGASTPDGPVGNCAHSDMCVFSFHPVKPITTAEGGMVTTNDDELAERLRPVPDPRHRQRRRRRTPGPTTRSSSDTTTASPTCRPRSAASQMLEARRIHRAPQRARRPVPRACSPTCLVVLPPRRRTATGTATTCSPIRVAEPTSTSSTDSAPRGIGVQVHYVPVHHHSVSTDVLLPDAGLPVADNVYAGLISLPMYAGLTDADQDEVVAALSSELA